MRLGAGWPLTFYDFLPSLLKQFINISLINYVYSLIIIQLRNHTMQASNPLPLTSLVERQANLQDYPAKLLPEGIHVSIGDLHGNALRLIYILIEEGILELSRASYLKLYDIYHIPTGSLTAKDLNEFELSIEASSVNLDRSITLLGDELCDRGNNDYFTLLLLKKLFKAGLDIEIILSNHSAEFIKNFSTETFIGKHIWSNTAYESIGISLTNMHSLVERGLITEQKIRQMIQECYYPMLKLVSYTKESERLLSIYTHAPVGLETIQALAKVFDLPYQDVSASALTSTIDVINTHFQELLYSNKLADLLLHEIYNQALKGPISSINKVDIDTPLRRVIWNRMLGHELQIAPNPNPSNLELNFVHGHTHKSMVLESAAIAHQHTCLDRFPMNDVSPYSHVSRHTNGLTRRDLLNPNDTLKVTRQKLLNEIINSRMQQKRMLDMKTIMLDLNDGSNLFMLAAEYGCFDLMDKIHSHRYKEAGFLDKKNVKGYSAFSLAAEQGHRAILDTLLQWGATPDFVVIHESLKVKGQYNPSPLDQAIKKALTKSIKKPPKAGCKRKYPDEGGLSLFNSNKPGVLSDASDPSAEKPSSGP